MVNERSFLEAYKNLNARQREAVDAVEGPVMVIAGPGTGKTQIIAVRIANILLKTDARPETIIALTFTDSGVRAMRERLVSLIGPDAYYVQIYTFHSFCSEVIRNNPDEFTISPDPQLITDLERFEIIHKAIDSNNFRLIKPANSVYHYAGALLSNIQTLKREGLAPPDFRKIVEEAKANYEDMKLLSEEPKNKISKTKLAEAEKLAGKNQELLEIYYLYQKELSDRGRFDFEDMIYFVVSAFRNRPELLLGYQERLQYLLVDEYQDTNNVQNNLIDALASFWGENANLFVVGDSNQSIFRFQGASLENVMAFKEKYRQAKIISLTENYRSTQTILDAADKLIKNNKHRTSQVFGRDDEKLNSQRQTAELNIGLANFSSDLAEDLFIIDSISELMASGVEANEIAVIFRKNKDAKRLADLCAKQGLPVSIQGGNNVLHDPYVQQLINLLRVVRNIRVSEEGVDLFTILNYSYLNLNPVDTIKISRKAAKEKVSIIDILSGKSFISSRLVENPESYLKVLNKLAIWLRLDSEAILPEVLEKISLDSGFIKYLESLPNSLLEINRLRGFFNTATAMYNADPNINLDKFLSNLSLMEQNNIGVEEPEIDFSQNAVTLTTAHKAKGLEWSYVFIYECIDGKWGNVVMPELIKLPPGILRFEKDNGDESKQERNEDERRLFYVALTRAKKQATITAARRYYQQNNTKDSMPSMFINEIPQDLVQNIETKPAEIKLQENLAKLLKPGESTEKTNEGERDLLTQIVSDYSLSASGLNTYLKCAYKFKLEQLIKVPDLPNVSMIFGQSVHKALELSYLKYQKQGIKPSKEAVIRYFKDSLLRQPLKEADKAHQLEVGRLMLSAYIEVQANEFKKPLFVEKWFGGKSGKLLLNNDIPLIGRVDRIELVDGNKQKVRIIDYKTGNIKTEGQISGTTADSSGELKRQLNFYKLLVSLDTGFKYEVAEVELDFVASPQKNKKWYKYSTEVSDEDLSKLSGEINTVMKEVRRLNFPRTSNYKNCDGCSFLRHCWPEGIPEKKVEQLELI